jgi:hypothetical protein
VDLRLVTGEQLEEQAQAAGRPPDAVQVDRPLDQGALLLDRPVGVDDEPGPAGEPGQELRRAHVRVVVAEPEIELVPDRAEQVLEDEAQLAHQVAADRVGPAVDRRQVLEVAAAGDVQRDLGVLVHHLATARPLLEHGVALLVALPVQHDHARQPAVSNRIEAFSSGSPTTSGTRTTVRFCSSLAMAT